MGAQTPLHHETSRNRFNFPLNLNGIVEIPVTLPQDHQMIHSLGISPKGTVEAWTKLMEETETVGGLCVILTHPDYELANPENLCTYEDLLNIITSNSEVYVALPNSLVKNATVENAPACA